MSIPQFKIVKPSTDAEKMTGTTLDTIEVTPNLLKSWKLPPAIAAWGRDPENARLWSSLNLALSMWIYRRLVLGQNTHVRTIKVSKDLFTKCMMTVAATEQYIDWLLGRQLNSRDISPAYHRLKKLVATRLEHEAGDGKKVLLPAPAWASNPGGSR